MKKKVIQVTEITIDDREAKIILTCLDYAVHRLSSEQGTGLHKAGVKVKDVDKMRTELRQLL